METKTWSPGSNLELDKLFEELRQKQYADDTHRLWKNYSDEFYKYAVALTICFDQFGNPEMCSSIASRDCWPGNAYRILNRLWKANNKIKFPRVMSPSFAESARSQIEWLKTNTKFEIYFISRQTNNWEDFGLENFSRYGLEFKKDKYFYLTCPNECDETCWQKIIYYGNNELLNLWKRRL